MTKQQADNNIVTYIYKILHNNTTHKMIYKLLYLHQKLNADMPVIIEHLETDEEYVLSVEKVKRLCELENIQIK